ncbi:MAG TPA: hypothetical protein VI792_10265 [Candidatus Eisenbacteria bacterium]
MVLIGIERRDRQRQQRGHAGQGRERAVAGAHAAVITLDAAGARQRGAVVGMAARRAQRQRPRRRDRESVPGAQGVAMQAMADAVARARDPAGRGGVDRVRGGME